MLLLAVVFGIIFFVGPRWGSRTPVVYVALTSLLGSITVMCCKALGVALAQTFRFSDLARGNRNGNAALESNAHSLHTLVTAGLGVGALETSTAAASAVHVVRVGVLRLSADAATHPLTWIALLLLVPCILSQLYYLNRGLASFDAGLVAPIQYVFFTVAVLALSALVYHEWGALPLGALLSVLVGFLIIAVGIFMLATSKRISLVIWTASPPKSRATGDAASSSSATGAHGGRYRTATWRRLFMILVDQSGSDRSSNSSKPPPRPELCVSCIFDRPPLPPIVAGLTDSDSVATGTPNCAAALVAPPPPSSERASATTETAPLIDAPTTSPHHLHLKWTRRRSSTSSEYGALQVPVAAEPIAPPPDAHATSNCANGLT